MYLLRCCDDTYYTGSTKYLQKRFEQHQKGDGSNYTARRLPVELVFHEEYPEIWMAFEREHQVKKWSKRKKEALILGDINNIKFLARCQNETHSDLRGL